MTQPGSLYILSAPSGGGKSSLAQALLKAVPTSTVSISHTTRPSRPGEQHGTHYYFIDQEAFNNMVAADEFVEHATVFGNQYGTSKIEIENLLKEGKDVLLDIDWQGMRSIKNKMPEAKSIFILPPSRTALQQRLKARGQDTDEVIANRMQAAVSEMRHYNEYDYVVINDDFESAVTDLQLILSGKTELKRKITIDLDDLVKT